MRRTCEFCEYYIDKSYDGGLCLRNGPVKVDSKYVDDYNAHEKARLLTSRDYKCKHWEPQWNNDERISKEWEKFKTSYALMANHGE